MKPNFVQMCDEYVEITTEKGVSVHLTAIDRTGESERFPRKFLLTMDWQHEHLGVALSYQDVRALKEWLRDKQVV